MFANEVVFQALAVLEDSFDVELTAAVELMAAASQRPSACRTRHRCSNRRVDGGSRATGNRPCQADSPVSAMSLEGNAALHNACMPLPPHRTPVALFVALTRAVRDAAVHDDVRIRAYDVIDRMAQSVGQPSFRLELDALVALASQHIQIDSALRPFWDDLRALVSRT